MLSTLQLSFLALSFNALQAVLAIPCSDIFNGGNKGLWIDGEWKQGLDPFKAGQGFDIVKAEETLVRFQNPGDNASPNDAWKCRVSQRDFSSTPTSMYNTIKTWHKGTDKLWLTGGPDAYAHANLLSGGKDFSQIDDSTTSKTMVSWILPPAAKTIKKVTPTSNLQDGDVQAALEAGVVGLNGKLAKSDVVYAPLHLVAIALAYRFNDKAAASNLATQPQDKINLFYPSGAWVAAEREDANQCVVIDFRSIPDSWKDVKTKYCGDKHDENAKGGIPSMMKNGDCP